MAAVAFRLPGQRRVGTGHSCRDCEAYGLAARRSVAPSVAREGIALNYVFTRPVTHIQYIEKLEATLWEAADNLRANSHKSSSEYCMPVLGVIFLRHATNRRSE